MVYSCTAGFLALRRPQTGWGRGRNRSGLPRISEGMSFAQQVAALRELFQVPQDAPLSAQVEMMNQQMGLIGDSAWVGPLPKQVQQARLFR